MWRALPGLFRNPRRRIVAMLVFFNLIVLAIVWVSLDAGYHQYQDRAATISRNTTRLVAQSVAGDFDRIDLGLRIVVDEIEYLRAEGTAIDRNSMTGGLSRLQSRLPMVNSLNIFDAHGEVVAGTAEGGIGADTADRDYFIRLRDDPSAGLVISTPVVGRVSGKWVLVLARRIERAEGGFAGIVQASVAIDWFEDKFRVLDVGPHGAVAIRGDSSRDFDLLARFPAAGVLGQTTMSSIFRATIGVSPQGGTYAANAGSDGIERIVTYQSVDPYPLIAMVGLATQDTLADWWAEAEKVLLLAGLFLVVTSLGSLGMLRSWRALEVRTEQLARSNADLEQFAYVASHDLQTPLRNIASYSQLLARRYKGKLDEDANDFIDYIVTGAKNMSAMISDILDYARVSASEEESRPVDLAIVVETVLSRIGPVIEAAGAQVCIGSLPMVLGDGPQMERLVQNLIENAVIYRHPDRPPRIEITAEARSDGMWHISVRDNGIGIDPDYREKVFVIFQRLAPIQFPGGTGIGLALCRRIVHRFGGTIRVDSGEGEGTTLVFTLRDALFGA